MRRGPSYGCKPAARAAHSQSVSQSVCLSFQSIGLSVCLPAHWSRVQLSFKCPRPEHASSGRRRSIAAPLCPRPVTLLVVCSIRTTLQRTRTRVRARSARAHESRPPPCTGGVERQCQCQRQASIQRQRRVKQVSQSSVGARRQVSVNGCAVSEGQGYQPPPSASPLARRPSNLPRHPRCRRALAQQRGPWLHCSALHLCSC